MISHEQDLVSLDELRSVLDTHAGPDEPCERPTKRGLPRFWRVLLVGLALAALVGAG
jgi:hypothetical protein